MDGMIREPFASGEIVVQEHLKDVLRILEFMTWNDSGTGTFSASLDKYPEYPVYLNAVDDKETYEFKKVADNLRWTSDPMLTAMELGAPMGFYRSVVGRYKPDMTRLGLSLVSRVDRFQNYIVFYDSRDRKVGFIKAYFVKQFTLEMRS
ncbi:MAG TPA: hypothetical protein P5056_04190 [Candidatus Paceibacterota bacterium]|nr:hypothetical protein [Candidatus Paceibacterota bacterium]